jgi:hypothetical protein
VKDKNVRAIFISSLLIVVLSFFRTFTAGTIRVDGHGLSGLPVFLVFFGFLVGLGAYSINFYRLWNEAKIEIGSVRLLAVILAALFSLMLPMMSNDLFSLLSYGDAANRGVDVYTDVKSLIISPFFDYVSPLWRTAPCVYGPVSLGTARLAAAMSGGHLLAAIAAYKVLAFIWSLVFIEMSFRIAGLLKTSVKPFIFVVLNPVFLLQGVAQLHCDMLAITICSCMLYFFFRRNWYLAFLLAGIAVVAKMNFILILGFLVVALFLEKESWLSFLYKTVGGICITVLVITAFYYPYYTSPDTFKVPFNFLFSQNPAKSIAEVMGDIVYFAPAVITGHMDELNSTMAKSSGVSDPQLVVWLGVKRACQLFAFILSAIIFVKYWFGKRESKQWMNVYLRFLLVFLLFYSHVFYAWYLMILLPFVWMETDKRFMQWLFVLTCFSNIHDIMCAVNHDTPVYFIVLPLTLLSVLVFFWRLRNNFFTSLNAEGMQG